MAAKQPFAATQHYWLNIQNDFVDDVQRGQSAVQLTAAVTSMGWEGVVAKRTDSVYQPGVRSRAWLKKVLNLHASWRH